MVGSFAACWYHRLSARGHLRIIPVWSSSSLQALVHLYADSQKRACMFVVGVLLVHYVLGYCRIFNSPWIGNLVASSQRHVEAEMTMQMHCSAVHCWTGFHRNAKCSIAIWKPPDDAKCGMMFWRFGSLVIKRPHENKRIYHTHFLRRWKLW